MSTLTIESLGLSKDDIADRVVDRLVDTMLHGYSLDQDGEEVAENTKFKAEIQERVKKRIDQAIDEIAGKHVLPNVAQYLETFCLQATNQWGEKKGERVTFVEYLVQRAEAYMAEKVNYAGKSKSEDGGYSWSANTTRVAYMIDKHLQYSIETAVKTALSEANKQIAGGLVGAVKVQLENALANIRVGVAVGK
jgi:hypothetical protein